MDYRVHINGSLAAARGADCFVGCLASLYWMDYLFDALALCEYRRVAQNVIGLYGLPFRFYSAYARRILGCPIRET